MYDLKHMAKMKKYGDQTPKAIKAFNDLNSAVFVDGALSAKVKELMALSVAVTTQCQYCIDFHNKQARAKGATINKPLRNWLLTSPLMRTLPPPRPWARTTTGGQPFWFSLTASTPRACGTRAPDGVARARR